MEVETQNLSNAPPQGKRRAPMRALRVKTVIAFSALIILMVCIFILFQASRAYDAALDKGRVNSQRLAQIMGDQVQLTFIAADLTLRRAVERYYFNQLFGQNLREDVENNLRLWVDETPQIAGLIVIDPQGIASIAAFKQGYQNRIPFRDSFMQHPLFAHLRDGNGNFAISAQSSVDGNLILLGREITLTNGDFGGVVLAVIDPEHFARFFASVETGSHRFMSLVQQGGGILFSGPRAATKDQQEVIEQIRASHLQATVPLSAQTDMQTIGGRIQIFSYLTLKNLPIQLVVTIDEEDFLREWRNERIKDVSFLGIFTVFGSVLTYFALTMAKQIRRVEESEAAAILASQAKSEFLANMSHELRTPLNAIIGFSEMINAGYFGDLTDKQRERIHDIHLCGSHLLQLISDILEFSKGEAGKLELYEEEIDLLEGMDECKRIISEKAQSKRIALNVIGDNSLPMLFGDKRKVRQILLNLLSNAIKFTPEGGSVTLQARIERHGGIQMSVSDTGIGIPEEDIAKALSVFGQVHRSQSHEGTGLGLPLCKMFTELHGGRLTLTSKVGVGTTVTITFPAERVRARVSR
jgi:signal transduction histidine kinase